jgi:transcription termination/antitermination protein NusA
MKGSAAMNRELVTGLAQLSAEKGLPKEVVSDIIARAIKRAYGDEEHIDVKVDVQTGAFKVYLLKTVVEKVEDPKIQIQLDAAKRIKPEAQLGEIVPLEESAAALGRIGAQTAKQVIQQSLREAEREQVFAEYADREGDIINAKISHFEAGAAIMELDRGATAILPRPEQAPHERYFAGQARKVVVLEVRRTLRGPQIIVSRAHKALVKRLFELEVPEIFHGQVEIVGIAREGGSRTKIAVRARQPGLDARGACIGQRGLRVQAIVNELGGEKIDIIEWAESPERFVANALEPAHVVRVDIVPEDKTAYVVVPDRQLSLAIGKEGQNARLAAKLTGWRIDIRSESEVRAELEPEPEPEPVAVAEPVPVEEESEAIRHDLVAEVEAESAQADEEELDEEDRALLGGKKKKERR